MKIWKSKGRKICVRELKKQKREDEFKSNINVKIERKNIWSKVKKINIDKKLEFRWNTSKLAENKKSW